MGVVMGSAGATTETEEETNQALESRPWPAMDYKEKRPWTTVTMRNTETIMSVSVTF